MSSAVLYKSALPQLFELFELLEFLQYDKEIVWSVVERRYFIRASLN